MIRKNSKLSIALSKLDQAEQDALGIEAQAMMKKEVQFLVYTYTKSTYPLVKLGSAKAVCCIKSGCTQFTSEFGTVTV